MKCTVSERKNTSLGQKHNSGPRARTISALRTPASRSQPFAWVSWGALALPVRFTSLEVLRAAVVYKQESKAH